MKIPYLILFLLFASVNVYSQNSLDALRAPTSPAASILGLEPTTTLNPKSFKTLEATLYSNFINLNDSNLVPDDFSIEFMPYWFNDHGLSLKEYLHPKEWYSPLLRNLSISIASSQNYILGENPETNAMSFGIRTSYFFPNKNDKVSINNQLNSLSSANFAILQINTEALKIVADDKTESKAEFISLLSPTVFTEIERRYGSKKADQITNKILNLLWDKLDSDYKNSRDEYDSIIDDIIIDVLGTDNAYEIFESYIENRSGLYIDIGYAFLMNFPENTFESALAPKKTFWLTPSFQFKKDLSFLRVLGVWRNERYDASFYKDIYPDSTVFSRNNDLGFSINGDFNSIKIQFEAVKRFSKTETISEPDNQGNTEYFGKKREDYQFIGTISYPLSEKVLVTYTFGEKFPSIIFDENSTFVSLLTLNFGFGGPTEESISSPN